MSSLDTAALQSAVDGVHRAGIPGVYAEIRAEGEVWRGAAGVADVRTGRPVTPDMRQRVGSVTKSFTAAAILQQVEQGRIELDTPIGHYLPLPGERGDRVTVRMLLNHTSGIAEYLPYAFPSLVPPAVSSKSLDDNRFTTFHPAALIRMGLTAPATGEPGGTPGVYSNTNYLLLGQLLEQTTGSTIEKYVTENVVERAGLQHTGFPAGSRIEEPHARMYESLWGMIDPPRDYSVYDMSWVWPSASLVSTVADLNLFYRKLLSGEIVNRSSLAQMQRTVPVIALDGQKIEYGLGLHRTELPDAGTFWGHDGTVWGALTISLTRTDGKRQLSVAMNLARWNRLNAPDEIHPIDKALSALRQLATRDD
jgi:D-alanyl-D-alanine carboxypeptidase